MKKHGNNQGMKDSEGCVPASRHFSNFLISRCLKITLQNENITFLAEIEM